MKRISTPIAFFLIALISMVAAVSAGVLGAAAAVFLYDRGTSKGNDLAVALIGLHAVGTFAFVVLFTFLCSRRGYAHWKLPFGALAACVGLLGVNTLFFSSAYDEYYAVFFLAGWALVALSGTAALAVCQRMLTRVRANRSEPLS